MDLFPSYSHYINHQIKGADRTHHRTYSHERLRIYLLKEMERSLNKKIDYLIYNDVQPNPTDKNVEDGLKIYKDENCDSIIAFGGGSTIDAAKGVLVIANHPGILDDYFSDSKYKRDITGKKISL